MSIFSREGNYYIQARRHGGGALEGQAPPVTGGAPPDEDEKFTVKHWSRWKIHLIIYGSLRLHVF